uniref:B30.2/SPRY domain-containing protein n=1 Tax=Paramormyrops kingsleyae TaxID=1676925 RepID=A0A3B3RAX5_9TELE
YRAQCPVRDPEEISGALINVVKHLGNLSYRVWEKMLEKKEIKYTPVILDPNTAGVRLTLSKDLTSIIYNDFRQKLPDPPGRFDVWRGILGSEGFSSGKHYWDVEVGDGTRWNLGVVRESIKRKGLFPLMPEGGVWSIELHNGKFTAKTSPHAFLSVGRKPQRIRVQLDWDRGELSFSDPSNNTPLYTFKDTFTEKLFPFFCTSDNRVPLKIYFHPCWT